MAPEFGRGTLRLADTPFTVPQTFLFRRPVALFPPHRVRRRVRASPTGSGPHRGPTQGGTANEASDLDLEVHSQAAQEGPTQRIHFVTLISQSEGFTSSMKKTEDAFFHPLRGPTSNTLPESGRPRCLKPQRTAHSPVQAPSEVLLAREQLSCLA